MTGNGSRFDRRAFLRTTGAAFAGVGLGSASAAAESTWRYELAGEALDPGTTECVVQGDWAYTATGTSIATVDVSDPTAPLLGGTALAHGEENKDVSVAGDLAAVGNDGDPGSDTNPAGVTFFDVSDPTTPVEASFYDDVDSGIHNLTLDGDHAFLTIREDDQTFADMGRMEVLDVSDPADPQLVGDWWLRDHHPDMSDTGVCPIHDIYIQDDLAYMAWWDAGVVIADVSDETNPTAVAHFGAAADADQQPDDDVEYYHRLLGGERTNAHYVQPTPSGDYTMVGAETFPGPFEDTVIPGDHGGIRIFDTSDLSALPDDPKQLDPVGYIPAPDRPDALRTAHNFAVDDEKVFASFYQGGLRAYDLADPTTPEELAAFAPEGTAYWTAEDVASGGSRRFTIGSDIGKGLTVLELVHETGKSQDWSVDETLGPRDVLQPTMREQL